MLKNFFGKHNFTTVFQYLFVQEAPIPEQKDPITNYKMRRKTIKQLGKYER